MDLFQKITKKLKSSSPKNPCVIDLDLFSQLQNLIYALDESKSPDLPLDVANPITDIQKHFIDGLFHGLLCNSVYDSFKKTDLAKIPIGQLVNSVKGGKENLNLENIKDAKGQGLSTMALNSNLNLTSNQGHDGNSQKYLYEACFEMAIYIMLLICENEEGEVNYDLSSQIVTSYIRHTRMHFYNRPQANTSASNQGQFCLQANLAMFKLLKNSKHLGSIAKDKDVLNFLFSLMPQLFKEEAYSSEMAGPDINLNSLIIGQGYQGGNQGQYQQVQVHQTNQGAIQSSKSSNQQQPSVTNQSPITNYEERKLPQFKKKLSFNRAASEPPSANKNAVMPVKEVLHQFNLIGRCTLGYRVRSKGKSRSRESLKDEGECRKSSTTTTDQLDATVIVVYQHQSRICLQLSYEQLLQPTSYVLIQHDSSKHWKRIQQHKDFQVELHALEYMQHFWYNSIVAKSRLTRRQISMSRKNTQKLSSTSGLRVNQPYVEVDGNKDNTRSEFTSHDITQQNQSISNQTPANQPKKNPLVPKLNINSIMYDNVNQIQRIEPNTVHNKSSNRSKDGGPYSNTNFERQMNKTTTQNVNQQYKTNQNVVRQIDNESREDNNVSYDEINNSFIDEMGGEGGNMEYIYDNAEEKLRQLAIQLGESCLTNDLAALISQRREIELVKSARKTVKRHDSGNHHGYQKSKTLGVKHIQRSVSVSYALHSQERENMFALGLSAPKMHEDMEDTLQSRASVSAFNNPISHDRRAQAINIQRVRLVILNIAYNLLKRYDIEEARFLKHPIPALNAFISSDKFASRRQNKSIRALEDGFSQRSQASSQASSRTDRIEISHEGKIIVSRMKSQPTLNHKLTQPSDTNLLHQITEANQSDFEEIKESDMDAQNEDSVASQTKQFITQNSIFQKVPGQTEQKINILIGLNKESIFQSDLISEDKIIFKIYSKFTFVNEDILKRQVMNELANFAAKEKGVDFKFFNTITSAKFNGSFAQGLLMVNNLIGSQHQQPSIPPLGIGTPIKSFNNPGNLSFDENEEDFYFRRERNPDAFQTLQNPNFLWLNNGIAYEMNSSQNSKSTAASFVSKEKIRKKLDVLLYNTDRRIKYIMSQYYDRTSQEFAEALSKELVTINSYLEEQNSRIMLFQLIEVSIESFLMIKRCLIENALKTNMFVMDFSKQMGGATPEMRTSSNQRVKSPGGYNLKFQGNNLLIENQRAHRVLFSEYLRLISNMLRMKQSPETMKLLNEVLVFDEQWQESVKTYSISLFLSDIVSTFILNERLHTQNASLLIEELRSINIINFDEPYFITQIVQAQNMDLYTQAKESIYHLILCSLNVMRYFKSVLKFFNDAIGLYFSHYDYSTRNKYHQTGSGNDGVLDNKDLKPVNFDKPNNEFGSGQKQGLSGEAAFDKQQQKYWKTVIRKVLYQLMYLITPPNGLLSQYLQNNAINYQNQTHFGGQTNYNRISSSPKKYHHDHQMQEHKTYRQCNVPLNFKLTKAVLSFTKLMFNLPDKFTRYVFIEELMLFYIRTHYISFIRLYNKNFSKQNDSSVLEQRKQNQPHTILSKEVSLHLCKKHLQCLFGIAKNRNEDTRRKLYQFKIVQFLCQEIDLEFDIQQRRNRFLQLSKEENAKAQLMVDNQGGDNFSDHHEVIKVQRVQMVVQPDNREENKSQPQIGISKPVIKKLNLGGVGAPSMFTGNDKPEIEPINPPVKILNEPPPQVEPPQMNMQKPKIGGFKLNLTGVGGPSMFTQPDSQVLPPAPQPEIQNQQTQPQMTQASKVPEEIKEQEPQNEPPKKKGPPLGFKLNLSGVAGASLFSGAGDPQPVSQLLNIQQPPAQAPPPQAPQNDQAYQVQILQEQENQDPPYQPNIAPQPQQQPLPQQSKLAALGIKKLNLGGIPGASLFAADNQVNAKPQDISLIELPEQQQQQVHPQIQSNPIRESLNLQHLNENQNTQPQENNEDQVQAYQQPNPVKKMPFGLPKLNVANLGLTGLIQDKADEAIVNAQPPNQQQVNEQEQPPPPQMMEKKKPMIGIPKLNVKGLTLSELVPDKNEEVKVQPPAQLEEEKQQPAPKKFSIPKLNTTGLGLSEIIPDTSTNVQFPGTMKNQEDMNTLNPGEAQNLTIDYGQMQASQQLFQKPDPNFDKTAPFLLSDNDKKVIARNIDLTKSAQLVESPNVGNHQVAQMIQTQNKYSSIIESQESAQFIAQGRFGNKGKQTHANGVGMIMNVDENELDEKRKMKLMQGRVNLIPPRNRSNNQSKRSEYDEQVVLFEKKEDQVSGGLHLQSQGYLIKEGAPVMGSMIKVESVIDPQSPGRSPDHYTVKAFDLNDPKNPLTSQKKELTINPGSNLFVPSNFNQTPTNLNQSSGGESQGSFIGKNKVYVPFLKFPDDINVDPAQKIKIYAKPDENRFKLIKQKDNTPEIKRESNLTNNQDGGIASQTSNITTKQKGFGKKGKLLNIGTQSNQTIEGPDSNTGQKDNKVFDFKMNSNEQEPSDQPSGKVVSNKRPLLIPPSMISKKDQEPKQEQAQEISQEVPKVQIFQESKEGSQPQRQPSLGTALVKKPMIPSLKIPAKETQPEGQDKIKQQIEYSMKLNESAEVGNLTKLEQSLNQQMNPKFQLLLDQKPLQSNQKGQLSPFKKANVSPKKGEQLLVPNRESLLTEETFYLKERKARPIYQDEELHVLMLSLLACLLLKPERGILDDLYCSQFPIDNGKQNVLFLLHHHLNHQENQRVVPRILRKVSNINPPLAGQRLLKLLCNQLFDLTLYNGGKDWRKIAEGAYAKVYEGVTNLSDPQSVAVKQMHLPSSIYDRCVLHDIFNEITCLEELRLEPCVTDLYDYGVDGQCYYIVQKRYNCSLKEWRAQQKKPLSENLSLYLSIYKEFLKSLSTIHSHNVTHYDIKCDNVLLDLGSSSTSISNNNTALSKMKGNEDDDRLKLTIGDFGECKMFSDDRDELDQRSRGTDYCKSPEMLQLAVNTRKDTDKYDRRKQVGTTRLSDTWSAGCLFYELLTGDFLFYDPDYLQFHLRVTRASEALFTPDRLDKINNNVYLIDFLKYMLVRDPRLRPSIESVLKRFEHLHALLVSTTAASANTRLTFNQVGGLSNQQLNQKALGQGGIENLIDQALTIMTKSERPANNSELINLNQEGLDFGVTSPLTMQDLQRTGKAQPSSSSLMQIMGDVYLANELWLKSHQEKALKMGITHIIIEEKISKQSFRDRFDILEIPADYSHDLIMMHNQQPPQLGVGFDFESLPSMNPFMLMPVILDFMRRVTLQKGKVLFVESSQEEMDQMTQSKLRLIRESLLICLNHVYQTNSYETYTLIRSQNLFFRLSSERFAKISQWGLLTNKIAQYMSTFPRYQCLCGSCVIVLKRQFASHSQMHSITCNCCQYYKNIESSQCPSPGCNEFIQYLKTYFKGMHGGIENLNWGFLEEEDFIVGPQYVGSLSNNSIPSRMLMSNMTQTIDKNSVLVSVIEKKSQGSYPRGGGVKDVIDYNMISKSSATVKNYNPGYARWKLFKCKECHVWTHAVNEMENRYALLLNNRVRDTNTSNFNVGNRPAQACIGVLNAKQSGVSGVRVPILKKIKMSIPF